jgi:hypothetical protein
VRGEFLEEFSLPNCLQFDEWLLMQRQQFQVQVTAVLEQLAAFHERAGQLAEAERTIRRLLEYDPLREAAYRQLMRVLARADQRSAALDVYETCRRVLATELGLAPAVETVTLAEQIRAHAPVRGPGDANRSAARSDPLFWPPARIRPPGRSSVTPHGQAGDIDRARRRRQDPPGIEVAHRMAGVFALDICLVELAGVTDGSSVDDAVAAALHLPTTGRSSTAAIVDYLRDKTLLLVLDNCEHLVKACARLVQTLCREAAGLTVLATSRIPLHLDEEHVVRLEPFATPAINGPERLTVADALSFDSVQLFTNRAAQSLLHFTLTDANVLAVARICQQLDGIPLAIEIAAAQVRALPIEAIAERLGQRFAWLNRQVAGTLPRQRTLHTLIDWSYGLLSQQGALGIAPISGLCRRVDFGSGRGGQRAGEPCAELLAELVTIHWSSLGLMPGTGATGCTRPSASLPRSSCAAAIKRRMRGNAMPATMRSLLPARRRTEPDNHSPSGCGPSWMTTITCAARSNGWLCMMASRRWPWWHSWARKLNFWELGGFFQEGRRWLQRALEGTQGSVSLQRGHALLAAADLSSAITDFDYGLQCVQQAQQLFQQLGDQRGEIDARLKYCDLAGLAGKDTNIQAQAEEALRMAEQISYTFGIAKASGYWDQLLTMPTCLKQHFNIIFRTSRCGANWRTRLNSQRRLLILV